MEDIFNPRYWSHRLLRSKGEIHRTVFECTLGVWQQIEERHRQILAATIGEWESVLDCGCGYGRLRYLLPVNWQGVYVGVDLSPDLIEMALRNVKIGVPAAYVVGDLRDPKLLSNWPVFDWGILCSVRPMIKRECGSEVWSQIEKNLRTKCKKLLYLEYDVNDVGSVE